MGPKFRLHLVLTVEIGFELHRRCAPSNVKRTAGIPCVQLGQAAAKKRLSDVSGDSDGVPFLGMPHFLAR